MLIDVFSLFPETMEPYLTSSILGKAQEAGLLRVQLHNIRDYTTDRHHTTDDEPYGGGGGMVMKPEPIFSAVESVLGEDLNTIPLVMLTPQGEVFDQAKAARLSEHERLAFLCGRYEGVDERVREFLVTEEISIGDYVLTGGELPAMVVIDALARQIPGVLGDADAAVKDSHAMGLLEYPHYTRPAEYRGWHVPDVLLSGNHANVDTWRKQEALRRTFFRRPDLLESLSLDAADKEFLKHLRESQPPRDQDQSAY